MHHGPPHQFPPYQVSFDLGIYVVYSVLCI